VSVATVAKTSKGVSRVSDSADAARSIAKKADTAATTGCFPAGTPTHGDPIGGDAWYDSTGAFLIAGIAATVAVHGAESRKRRRRQNDGDELFPELGDGSPEDPADDIELDAHLAGYEPGEYERQCIGLFHDDDDFWRGDDTHHVESLLVRRSSEAVVKHSTGSEARRTCIATVHLSTASGIELALAEPRLRRAAQPMKQQRRTTSARQSHSFGFVTKLCIALTLLGTSFGLWQGWQADRVTVRPIEDYRVGQRVIVNAPAEAIATDFARLANLDAGWNAVDGSLAVAGVEDPLRRLVAEASAEEITRADYRKVIIRAQDVWPDGTVDVINLETLQPWQWLHANEAHVGSWIALPLDVAEMGLSPDLQGKILDILPCPPIQPGRGRIVLTTVNHLNSDVRELTLRDPSGREEQLQVTAFHKFYSVSHGEWVSAVELQPGETLDGVDGKITAVASRQIPGKQRVYNFTVQGEHFYRVANCGVLVHNNKCDNIVSTLDARKVGGGKIDLGGPDGVVYKRTDLNGEIKPYGGQAESLERYAKRQQEHARNHPNADFDFEIVERANPGAELDVAEHNFVQELTGGKRAKYSPEVSNLKDPVGKARRGQLGLPEPGDPRKGT
jgi:hypothetical protein